LGALVSNVLPAAAKVSSLFADRAVGFDDSVLA
jgi:hypothetical protein